jgi:hypothetical protein
MPKRITTTLIRKSIPVGIRQKLSRDQIQQIETCLVKHLLLITSCKEYSTELKKFFKTPIIKVLRNNMLGNFDFIIRLKFSLLEILSKGYTADNPKIAEIFSMYDLSDHYVLIDYLREQRLYNKARKRAHEAKIKFAGENHIISECGKLVASLDRYITMFVYRKLSFISKSENIPIVELVDELKEKAISSYYMLIPFHSTEHTFNAVKRAVHNEGINMIKYFTAAKRRRLNNDGDGKFSNTLISIDFAAKNDEGEGENPKVFKNVYDPQFDRLNLLMSLQSVMKTHGQHPRKRKVLKLIQMEPDTEFAKQANQMFPNVVRASLSTEEIFDKLGREDFLHAVCQYTQVKPAPFYDFMRELKRIV